MIPDKRTNVGHDGFACRERAITDFAKAIALDSKHAIYYFNRGDASDDKSDYDQAVALSHS